MTYTHSHSSACHLFILCLFNCICLSFPLMLRTGCRSDCISSWVYLFSFNILMQLVSKKTICLILSKPIFWENGENIFQNVICWNVLSMLSVKQLLTMKSHQPARLSTVTVTITKTYLYNINSLKPHFYIVKLGFTGVYIIFLISAQKHRLWVLVRTASPRRF